MRSDLDDYDDYEFDYDNDDDFRSYDRRRPTRRSDSNGARGRARRAGADEKVPSLAGCLIWPFVFVLVAVLAVGGFAVWRRFSVPKKPVAEEPTKRSITPVIPPEVQERVDRMLEDLTLEQKVAQLFIVRPESLTGVERAIAAGDATREALTTYPVGGICYFSANLESPKQTKEMLRNSQNYVRDACGLPLFACVEEEGGTVVCVASNEAFGAVDVGDMRDIGQSDSVEDAFDAGRTMGTYLSELGFNVDFAPVADIVSSESSVMYDRSFGTDANEVGKMVAAQVEGFTRAGVLCAAKHFPGIGGANGDPYDALIYTSRTANQFRRWELVPFESAIDAQVPMIMVGHLSCLGLENSTGDLPASMDPAIVDGMLRDELGYNGLVVTDSLETGAVTGVCNPDEQAIRVIEAGGDLVLLPQDFHAAYNGLLGAVKTGKISEARIDESVRRVIYAKLELL